MLDVVKNSLWVDVRAYTTAEVARNADARLVAPVVSELFVELIVKLRRDHTTLPDSSRTSWVIS